MKEKEVRRAIALGFFDGVHCGHRALMDMAVRRAKENGAISSVFTFDRHPNSLVSGKNTPLITSPIIRADEIKEQGGVDEVIFAHFDRSLMEMDWKEFVDKVLYEQFHACWIITGENNRFGYRGQGTPARLAEECARLGIGCDTIPNVTMDDIVVSSTYIRGLIAQGDIERANRFLGHPYTIAGVVAHGRTVGRSMGIPTCNIPLPEEMQLPPNGVYVSRVIAEGGTHIAATNIGERPTFANQHGITVEPHLLDFSGDLYGKLIRVELYRFLRPEHKFSGVEELKKAIAADVRQTRAYFEDRRDCV
ncbi:MAG: bifunctional riboflavin kinase/FAD synthetase [Butyricicoccaceae bacterium]